MYLVYFHNVIGDHDDCFDQETPRVTSSAFERHLDWLEEHHSIISFDECLERVETGEVDEPLVALCFDDGHLGVHRYAYPSLQARGITAGVFVLNESGTPAPTHPLLHFEELEIAFRLTKKTELDRYGVAMHTRQERAAVFEGARQRLKALPDSLRQERQSRLIDDLDIDVAEIASFASHDERFTKLGPSEQHELASAGWILGGHTRTHRVLSRLGDQEIDREVAIPARVQTQPSRTRKPFAYPYGGADHCDERVADRIRAAGYDCAFTTISGPILPSSLESRYLLPRLSLDELKRLVD